MAASFLQLQQARSVRRFADPREAAANYTMIQKELCDFSGL
jgi:hypothetical protein